MVASESDPGFDAFVRQGWQVRDVFVPTDEGRELDGTTATRRLKGMRLQVYQGCQGIYVLQGQGRGRPKAHVLVGWEWMSPSWYVDRPDGGRWARVGQGSAGSVLNAAEAAEACAGECR